MKQLLFGLVVATLLHAGCSVEVHPKSGLSIRNGSPIAPRDESVDNYITMVIENFAAAMKTGIPFLGIPILDPFNISVLPLPEIVNPAFTLLANASDISVRNTSSFQPTYVHVDFDTNTMYLDLHFYNIRVDGWYWCDGLMMAIFPIFGEGTFFIDIKTINSTGLGSVFVTADNHLQIADLKLDIQFETFEMFFDNFLGGGSFGEEMNEALSLLAQTIIEAIMPLLNTAILPAFIDFLNDALMQNTIDEIIDGVLPSFPVA